MWSLGSEIFRHTCRERSEDGIEVGRNTFDSEAAQHGILPSFEHGTIALTCAVALKGALALKGFSAAVIGDERKRG